MLLIGLIAGIIIGWLIEWIIDWWFWRNEDGPSIPFLDAERPNAEVQRALDEARAEAADLRSQLASLQAGTAQVVGTGGSDVGESEIVGSGPVLTLSNPTVASTPTIEDEADDPAPDNLKLIKGIGRVYEGKLNDAGIYTFSELVNASADQLNAAIEPKEWQALDFEDWAAQASSLAKSSPVPSSQTKGE